MKVVVTGGGGYVGYHVGWALSRGGFDVLLYDLAAPDPEWEELAPKGLWDALPQGFWGPDKVPVGKLEYVKGNITDYDQLLEAFRGSVGVVHSASLGISARDQHPPRDVILDQVNIHGTRNVVNAATKAGVRALVYTSSMNVGFGGKEVFNGDESLPYYPINQYLDVYSKTKAISEMLVLMANGRYELDNPNQYPIPSLPNLPSTPPPQYSNSTNTFLPPTSLSQTFKKFQPPTPPNEMEQIVQVPTTRGTVPLRTAAVRPGGIMGLGERTHINRVMFLVRAGLMTHTVGKTDCKGDWIMIQNIVQAHVKLLMALLYESSLPWEIKSPLHGFVRHPMWATHINNNNTMEYKDEENKSDTNAEHSYCAKDNYMNKSNEQNLFEQLESNQEVVKSNVFTDNNQSQKDDQRIHTELNNNSIYEHNDDLHLNSQRTKDNLETKPLPSAEWDKEELPPSAAGRTFYISEEAPINQWEFFRAPVEGLGYTFPKYNIPVLPVILIAYFNLFLYKLLYRIIPTMPLVTPAEIKISSIGHYYSCKAAREAFGYAPTRPNDYSLIVDYLKKHEAKKREEVNRIRRSFIESAIALFLGILLFVAWPSS